MPGGCPSCSPSQGGQGVSQAPVSPPKGDVRSPQGQVWSCCNPTALRDSLGPTGNAHDPTEDMLCPMRGILHLIGNLLSPIRATFRPVGDTLSAVGVTLVAGRNTLVPSLPSPSGTQHTQTSLTRVSSPACSPRGFQRHGQSSPIPPAFSTSSHPPPPRREEGAPPPPAICAPSSLCQHWLECGLISGGMSPPAWRSLARAISVSSSTSSTPFLARRPPDLGTPGGGHWGLRGCCWSCCRADAAQTPRGVSGQRLIERRFGA